MSSVSKRIFYMEISFYIIIYRTNNHIYKLDIRSDASRCLQTYMPSFCYMCVHLFNFVYVYFYNIVLFCIKNNVYLCNVNFGTYFPDKLGQNGIF